MTYGRIIITENFSEKKTINTQSLGGLAGGEKFSMSSYHEYIKGIRLIRIVCGGILFKFARDSLLHFVDPVTKKLKKMWMYGNSKRSDEKAMKSVCSFSFICHFISNLNHRHVMNEKD